MVRNLRRWIPAVGAAALLVGACAGDVRAQQPYAADANTLGLWHFDEAAGAADPGNPFANVGTGGSALNFTNTGGPDGRDDAAAGGTGGYGAPALPGFGSAFHVYASGNGSYNGSTTGAGGGATTAGAVLQSALQGADGAFTYEALIKLGTNATAEQQILAHDGGSTRGFLFRVLNNTLAFYTGVDDVAHAVNLPAAGNAHAFDDADGWYHAAITYDGSGGTAGNLKFYWTAMDAGATQANQIGAATLAADLPGSASNLLGVGTTTRSPFRVQAEVVDEVRISGVARGASEFLLPEPGCLSLLGLGAAALVRRTRRRTGARR